MKGSNPKIIFLARDMLYHTFMGCDDRTEAETYINNNSGKGYIEKFELSGDYYKFISAEWIGMREKKESQGPVFGDELHNKQVHKNNIRFILNYIK